jgi:hypothetical protein
VDDVPGSVPAKLAAQYLGGTRHVCLLPLASVSLDLLDGDMILVARAQAPLLGRVAAGLDWPGLAAQRPVPGAYHVLPRNTGHRRQLAILGGDLAGLLYGIIHVGRLLQPGARGVAYDAGEFHEIPAIRHRIYWTWDHSTNWMLDSAGMNEWGSRHAYLKPPGMFLEDMKRLVDHALDSRASGVLIWGFLRDGHGGIDAGQDICRYA